jgi:hypothetical protein
MISICNGSRISFSKEHNQFIITSRFSSSSKIGLHSRINRKILLRTLLTSNQTSVISCQPNTSQNSSSKNIYGIAFLFMYPSRCYRQVVTTNLTPNYITNKFPYDLCNNTLKNKCITYASSLQKQHCFGLEKPCLFKLSTVANLLCDNSQRNR